MWVNNCTELSACPEEIVPVVLTIRTPATPDKTVEGVSPSPASSKSPESALVYPMYCLVFFATA